MSTPCARLSFACMIAVTLWLGHGASAEPHAPVVVLQGAGASEIAPHGQGNVYAPDVLVDNGVYRMWYGGLGKDGHDRIHLAESNDGRTWKRRGVVLEDDKANHVNDPSVVKVGDTYYMYYTVAAAGVTDRIDVATSTDGVKWTKRGIALRAGDAGQWDSLLVGRPSVLHENGLFRMWYDGRKDLPLGAPDATAPKSPDSHRSVGLAVSRDGIHWTRHDGNPVFGDDAGGIHVSKRGDTYVMVYESHQGARLACSNDGTRWRALGPISRPSLYGIDDHGHVTPFLLSLDEGRRLSLFTGAARAPSWDRNCIIRLELDSAELDRRLQAKIDGD